MQLLQVLRDSSALDKVVREIEEVERFARSLSSKLISFLNQSPGNIHIYSYTGFGYSAASLLYWASLIFQGSKHPVLAESEESSIYLLPYREDYSAIVFSTGEYSKLIQSLQVLRILGVEYLAFSPTPPNEMIRNTLRYYNVELIPTNDSVSASLYTTLASFIAISEIYKSSLNIRGKRLFEHGREGFTVTVKSFIEKYSDVIEASLSKPITAITSTRFLEGAGILLSHVLRSIGVEAVYLPVEEALTYNKPLLGVFLSSEERLRREFKTQKGSNLYELVLNVEPLEGIVYTVILSYVLYKLVKQ